MEFQNVLIHICKRQQLIEFAKQCIDDTLLSVVKALKSITETLKPIVDALKPSAQLFNKDLCSKL